MEAMEKAPSLFVSHGAPTFALEASTLVDKLALLGEDLHHIKAVLLLSPHWQTNELEVMTNPHPETIHDFYGFPEALYEIQYPVRGAVAFAKGAADLLAAAGLDVLLNPTRGLDHGAWVPLMHIFAEGQIPVFQVSLPYKTTPQDAFNLGRILSPLKDEGVLIIGTGGVTHNLGHLMRHDVDLAYVSAFGNWVRKMVLENRVDDLLNYRKCAPYAVLAHPTEEHFLPLFVVLGSRAQEEKLEVIDGEIAHDILCMDSYLWRGSN